MGLLSIYQKKTENNLLLVRDKMLDFFQIKHTKLVLADAIDTHVDAPSFLTIKDILAAYGIESAAIRRGANSYANFDAPFVCAIQQEDWTLASFTLVFHVDENAISYLDPLSNTTVSISLEEFERMDKDIILLLDSSTPKHEINYTKNVKIERLNNLTRQLPAYLFVVSVLLVGIQIFQQPLSIESVVGAGFLLTGAVGLLISILLLLHELDNHNPIILEVCGGIAKKMNCNAVLSSSDATFLGMSWSTWGFAYFATFFVSQMFLIGNKELLPILSFASLVVFPYILYSLYYQWKVVKQWCPLCLVVQILLLSNLGVSIAGWSFGVWLIAIDIYTVALFSVAILIFLLSAYTVIPLIKRASASGDYEKRWKKLRYHPDVFRSFLSRSERVYSPAEELGILVGNPDARNEITKVCNPYCGLCANAHPQLEQIVRNNKDVKVRIIFTASGEEHDIKTAPVQHLLAIQEKYGSEKVHVALEDWYLAEEKDYGMFAEKYPMNGELKQQESKIRAMREWCDRMKIRATPTFYINERELPDSYRVNELKNFF